jgi:hypothetical protein
LSSTIISSFLIENVKHSNHDETRRENPRTLDCADRKVEKANGPGVHVPGSPWRASGEEMNRV